MHERALNIAYQTALLLEEQLTEAITGEHELYFDHDVDNEGNPYVAVSVGGTGGVAKLSKLFGDAVRYTDRHGTVAVSVLIKDLKPLAMMQ